MAACSRPRRLQARAQLLVPAAFEREVRQEHARLFAEFRERQAEVRVDVEPLLRRLVEDRHALVVVAAFEEGLHERLGFAPAGPRDRRAPPTCVPGRRTSRMPCARRSTAVPCRRGTRGSLSCARCGRRSARPRRARKGLAPARRAAPDASAAARPRTSSRSGCRPSRAGSATCPDPPRSATTAPATSRRGGTQTDRGRSIRPRPRACETTHVGENGMSKSAALRSNSSRLTKSATRSADKHERLLVVEALEQRRDDADGQRRCSRARTRRRAAAPAPTRRRAARSRRRCRRSARARSPASGTKALTQASRPAAVGVAPENSSTAPASIVKTASSFGATDIVRVPKALPHWPTSCRR